MSTHTDATAGAARAEVTCPALRAVDMLGRDDAPSVPVRVSRSQMEGNWWTLVQRDTERAQCMLTRRLRAHDRSFREAGLSLCVVI